MEISSPIFFCRNLSIQEEGKLIMTLCHGSGVYWPVSYGGGYGLTIRKFG
jgi:hypothetical protein